MRSLLLVLAGCTGYSLHENAPGDDTWLVNGSIAVDPRTDFAFTLREDRSSNEATLWGIPPVEGLPVPVLQVDEITDTRIQFPRAGVLVQTELDETSEQLTLLSSDDLSIQATATLPHRFHGTRMSPSRRWIAVADNAEDSAPIYLLDPETLTPHRSDPGGGWLEAMWANTSDVLYAAIFDLSGQLCLRAWEVGDDPDLADVPPLLDLPLPDAYPALIGSFSWIGVSPDDRWVVVPVWREEDTARHELMVLDRTDDSVRAIPGGGPVGFTPDSSTILAHDESDLLLIDPLTGATEVVPIPIDDELLYFVSHAQNLVVLTAAFSDDQQMVVLDIDTGQTTRLGGEGIGLTEFVARQKTEVWLVDEGLFELDMAAPSLIRHPLDFVPGHINLLPGIDRLVIDEADSRRIHFVDPVQARLVRTISLP